MDYEPRALALVQHAQVNLEDLWKRCQGDTAGSFFDSFTTNPTELNQLRDDYVTAASAWQLEAQKVLNVAPSGPYVDHLSAWFNTVHRQKTKLTDGGWGRPDPLWAGLSSWPGEVGKDWDKLLKTLAVVGVVVAVAYIALKNK